MWQARHPACSIPGLSTSAQATIHIKWLFKLPLFGYPFHHLKPELCPFSPVRAVEIFSSGAIFQIKGAISLVSLDQAFRRLGSGWRLAELPFVLQCLPFNISSLHVFARLARESDSNLSNTDSCSDCSTSHLLKPHS